MKRLEKFLSVIVFVSSYSLVMAQGTPDLYKNSRAYKKLVDTEKEYRDAMLKGDSLEVAEMCYLMGKRYIGLNNYYKARQWFLRSLRIREPLGPSEDIGKVYCRLSECDILEDRTANANKIMQFARKAFFNFSSANSPKALMTGYRALGGAHSNGFEAGKIIKLNFNASIDSAIYYHEKSLDLAVKLKLPIDVALSYQLMSDIWELKSNPHKAILYKTKALRLYEKNRQLYNVADASVGIAASFLKLSKPREAKKWLKYSSTLLDSLKDANPGQIASMEEAHAKYYHQIGDWEKAFEHLRIYQQFKVKELETYRDGAIKSLTMVYENEKKEIQLKAQQKELAANQQNMKLQLWLIILTALLFVFAGVAGVFFFRLFRKYEKISHENAELVKEQNHRTKNNLQAVSDLLNLQLIRLSDPIARQVMEESLLRVEAMSMVHQRLYGGDKLVEVELGKYVADLVLSVLRSYDLRHVRVSYDIEEIWLHSDKAIPLGLIVNELTTNACKYALGRNPDPALRISCQEMDGWINFEFCDNGPGFVPGAVNASFGLKLVDLMVKNLKGVAAFRNDQGSGFLLSFEPDQDLT